MKKSIYKELEAITERIMNADGKCIIIAHDGKSEKVMLAPIMPSADDAIGLFMDFFQKFPEFIPKAMYAAALAMECDGDCDNCDKHCGDDEICLN